MYKEKKLFERSTIQAQGNAVLLVIVDTKGPYWHNVIVDETITCALMHFGIPFRFLDISSEAINAGTLKNCAGIILAQNLAGAVFSEEDAMLISKAVKEEGIGFVGFDNDIRYFKPGLLEMFGFKDIDPYPYAAESIRISGNSHYITGMRKGNEAHDFKRTVTCISAGEWSYDTEVVASALCKEERIFESSHVTSCSAYEPQEKPCIFAARWGKGHVVQFLINPRIWRKDCLGHAQGIDDIFFRALIWASKKPFAANVIPPFVTMSFDDCAGRHDFIYTDILNKAGLVPILFLFLDLVSDKQLPRIRNHVFDSCAEYASHGFSYYDFLTFEMGKGPYNESRMKEAFLMDDRFWEKAGCRPSPINRNHHGEWTVNAIKFLKERKRMFFSPAHQPDVLKSDQSSEEGYWPYGLTSCCYDYLPDDPEFYIVGSNIKKNSNRHKYSEDFFDGATPMLNDSKSVDVDKIADNIYFQLHEGIKSGFFGEARTHEQKFGLVSLAQWEQIIKQLRWKLKELEYIPAGLSKIAKYLKHREQTYISGSVAKEGLLEVNMEGRGSFETLISVFSNTDGEISRQYHNITDRINYI